jgi:hypothetical protein
MEEEAPLLAAALDSAALLALVRLLRVDHALLFAEPTPAQERLTGVMEMFEGGRVLLALQISALEVQQLLDRYIDHIFDSASVDAYLIGVTVLKHDADEGALNQRLAPVHASKFVHVLAHLVLPPVFL